MKIPLTKYGLPQVIVYPLFVLVLMILLFAAGRPGLWIIPLEILLFLVFIWMLSFFRDPPRTITEDETLLLSPADGKITEISFVESDELGTPEKPVRAIRIGMFLSIFNVHINRAPCSCRVEKVIYKKGSFKNAMDPESGRVNESNAVYVTRLCEPASRLLIRQVSGAVARHIVCRAKEGAEYRQGEPFGMIKFGSRTELYIPIGEKGSYEILARPGKAVRAGLTPLLRYRP